MRRVILILAVAATLLLGQMAESDVMLQRAIRKETVEGDLNGAIDLYRKVISGAAKNREAAAKALLHLGKCYEKQGNAEARRAYERLVKEFGDQGDAAREAQARLSAMGMARGSGTVMAQLIERGPNVNTEVHTTPDGRLLAFVDQESGNAAVRDLLTGKVRYLTSDATGDDYGQAHAHTPFPSHNGKQIAYVWDMPNGPSAFRAELRVIGIDGRGMRTVAGKPGAAGYNILEILDWFPDGEGLLVWAAPAVEDRWSGFVKIDLKSGAEHRIFESKLIDGSKTLSADGRWVLYSKASAAAHAGGWDIFAVDIQTGRPAPLMAGPASDRDPVWIPGSDRFIFHSDRSGKDAIWMARFRDGQILGEPQLVKPDAGDFRPAGISRDGSLFYTVSHTATDVYQAAIDPHTMRVQGAPLRMVESYLGHNTSPSWSPSGASFAYYSDRDISGVSRIIVHHADGKETVIAQPVNHSDTPPIWCVGEDRVLSLWTPRGTILRFFDTRTGEAQPDRQIDGLKTPYQWTISSDCQTIYVSSFDTPAQRRRIYRYDMTTGKETDLLVDGGQWAVIPRISPDGRWLALIGEPEGAKKRGLVVLPAAGGAMRMLDANIRDLHVWTPDSKGLIYARSVKRADGQGKENELYWVPLDGGAPQSLGIRMPGATAPSLNADGKRILFSTTENSNELWVLRNLSIH